jgi:hypothetical protein
MRRLGGSAHFTLKQIKALFGYSRFQYVQVYGSGLF